MAIYLERKGIAADAEPVGLLTEGAAGIAAIVLAVIALAGVSTGALASITTIIIGVALMVQAFNTAAEVGKAHSASASDAAPTAVDLSMGFGGEIMIYIAAGLTGIILGILGLVGIHTGYLLAAALIVFGAALILSSATANQAVTIGTGFGSRPQVNHSAGAVSGLEVMIGFAAIVLGILSLVLASTSVLILVGFIAVGAALLMVSASFSGAVARLFATTP
jgi:hypothetical protein